MSYLNRFNQVALAAVTFGALSVSAFAAQSPNLQVAGAADFGTPAQQVGTIFEQPPHSFAGVQASVQNIAANYQRIDEHNSAKQATQGLDRTWQHH